MDQIFETGSSKMVTEGGRLILQAQGALWIMLIFLMSGCRGSMSCSSAQPLQSSGKLPVPEQKVSRSALMVVNNLSTLCEQARWAVIVGSLTYKRQRRL